MVTTNARVHAARELLNPLPVEIGHYPNWLASRIRRLTRYGRFKRENDEKLIARFWPTHGQAPWMDHWGYSFCERQNGHILVAEPYGLSGECVDSIREFANSLELWYTISSNSWWNPGRTIRIEFHPYEWCRFGDTFQPDIPGQGRHGNEEGMESP